MPRGLFQFYKDSFSGLRREVWILSGMTFLNRAGTMVIPFMSLYLTDRLGFTFSQVGWILTAFGFGSLAGSWLGGKLTDKIGFYVVMWGSLLLSGIMFIALQYVTAFWPFIVTTFILMVFADAFRPANLAAITVYSKPENRTRSVTLVRLAINLGFSFGPALGGFIIVSLGYSALFWVDGLTCLAAVAVFLIFLPRPEHEKPQVLDTPAPVVAPFRNRSYIIFLLLCFLMGFAFMQLFSTIPLYYRDIYHLNEKTIGWLMGANGLIIFIFEMPLVNFFERHTKIRLRVIQAALVLIGLSLLVFAFAIHPAILIVNLLLITTGEMLGFPFSNTIAMNRAPEGKSGIYLAYYTMAYSLSHMAGPNTGLQLAERYGFNTCWVVMAGVCVLAIILAQYIIHTEIRTRSN